MAFAAYWKRSFDGEGNRLDVLDGKVGPTFPEIEFMKAEQGRS
jgi:hypothetical protein